MKCHIHVWLLISAVALELLWVVRFFDEVNSGALMFPMWLVVLLFKLRSTSRKLTICKPAYIVMFKVTV